MLGGGGRRRTLADSCRVAWSYRKEIKHPYVRPMVGYRIFNIELQALELCERTRGVLLIQENQGSLIGYSGMDYNLYQLNDTASRISPSISKGEVEVWLCRVAY
jgi:hypothetical protein